MISEQNIASLIGGNVTGTDGHKIGTIGQIYVDPDTGRQFTVSIVEPTKGTVYGSNFSFDDVTFSPDGRTLVPVPSEVEALALMRELASANVPLRKIAAELDARGYPTKGNAPKWSHVSIMKMLARPVTD